VQAKIKSDKFRINFKKVEKTLKMHVSFWFNPDILGFLAHLNNVIELEISVESENWHSIFVL